MYDLEWCRMIVAEFEDKHAKGCELFRELYGVPHEWAVGVLLQDQVRWRAYKAWVKHVEGCWEMYQRGYEHSRDAGSNYYTFVKYLRRVLKRRSFPAPLDLLDTEVVFDESLEASKRRDGPTEVTREGRHSS